MVYHHKNTTQVISRPNGSLNPICNRIKPNDTTACTQHSVDGNRRFLYWPHTQECCLDCVTACGTLTPAWVDAVPSVYAGKRQIRGVTCYEFVLESGTPDRVANNVLDGSLCELYDGGANGVDDMPFGWEVDPASWSTKVDPAALKLPSYCSNAPSCK